jgi:arylsulfatase A-like enzyme
MPGIARVFRGEELGEPSASDALQRAAALSYFPGRSGDLVIAPKPGWMFVATGTTHGNAVWEDQHVPLVLLGAGIKRGRYTERVTPADIAPTLAALAGLKMSKIDGHVLEAALVH